MLPVDPLASAAVTPDPADAQSGRRRRRPVTREALVKGVLAGDRRAVARAISLAEDDAPLAGEVVADLYPHTGGAMTVGITGAPGVGKSSVISALVAHLRAEDRSVGVVSVDPSSPFTQGALLGDRIRLTDHFLDPGVYIRSMGTRGRAGGLAEATLQAGLIVEASGRDVVLYETVGVGQSEVAVASLADTVVLVLMPGSGDSIQALKAGIMEIPDLIVVNKADHPQAGRLRGELRQVLGLADRAHRPPVVETRATDGYGIPELWARITAHRAALEEDGLLEERRRRSLEHEVFELASARAARHLASAVEQRPELRALLDEVGDRRLDPLTAVRRILEQVYELDGGDA
jgi:LAO/AO transport system kinase